MRLPTDLAREVAVPSKREDDRRPLRLALVITWRDLGRWLWGYLPEKQYEADLIFAVGEPGSRGIGRRLPPYVREFFQLARRRTDFDRYDVVFTWELRAALATLLWRRLTGQRRAKVVALGPIFKGPVQRALPLIRLLLADADRLVCFSTAECVAYAELLRLPPERFVFSPLAWLEDESESTQDDGYILALGHSGRDYPLLLEAVRGTNLPVTIVSEDPGWLNGVEPPPNVRLLYKMGFHESNALIAGATFHVIPLKPAGYSAGQSVLLKAMARGKAVVVSDTAGIRDYVHDGETAIIIPPDDAAALREALLRLWDSPAERARLGHNAARTVREEFGFSRFARRLADLAEELTQVKYP